MSQRFIAPWLASGTKPAIYHCSSRVVERGFAFGAKGKGPEWLVIDRVMRASELAEEGRGDSKG